MTQYDNGNTRLSIFAFSSIMYVGGKNTIFRPNVSRYCLINLKKCKKKSDIFIGSNCFNFILIPNKNQRMNVNVI